MANARRAIEIYLTIAAIEADSGPMVSHYAVPLDYPRLYKWWIANTSTVDHVAVLGHTGGTAGRWLQVRCDDRGANLTDADATIGVDGKPVRYLPAATLTANRTLTLSATNAAAGDTLTIVRLDATANTLALYDTATTTTLTTLPISERWSVDVYFTGTSWALLRAGKLP